MHHKSMPKCDEKLNAILEAVLGLNPRGLRRCGVAVEGYFLAFFGTVWHFFGTFSEKSRKSTKIHRIQRKNAKKKT